MKRSYHNFTPYKILHRLFPGVLFANRSKRQETTFNCLRSLILSGLMILSFNQASISQEVIEIISKSVGLIYWEDKTKPGQGSSGTGTLILKSVGNDSVRIFLVTNKHVLPQFAQNQFAHFRIQYDFVKEKYLQTTVQIYDMPGKYSPNVKEDPDGNDLVVIDFTNYFLEHPEASKLLGYVLPFEFLANTDTLPKRKITVGQDIFFIGYPTLMFDKRNTSPIVRTGIISTSPSSDFYFSDAYRATFYRKFGETISSKLDGFLIDATALGGSSGSLVITKPLFFRLNSNGKFEQYNDPKGEVFILGILSESYPDLDNRLTGFQRANLGGVISAAQIIKTITSYMSTK